MKSTATQNDKNNHLIVDRCQIKFDIWNLLDFKLISPDTSYGIVTFNVVQRRNVVLHWLYLADVRNRLKIGGQMIRTNLRPLVAPLHRMPTHDDPRITPQHAVLDVICKSSRHNTISDSAPLTYPLIFSNCNTFLSRPFCRNLQKYTVAKTSATGTSLISDLCSFVHNSTYATLVSMEITISIAPFWM
jgi:hypothetical protein